MVSITSKNQGIFMKFICGRQEFKIFQIPLGATASFPPQEVEEDPNQTWAVGEWRGPSN